MSMPFLTAARAALAAGRLTAPPVVAARSAPAAGRLTAPPVLATVPLGVPPVLATVALTAPPGLLGAAGWVVAVVAAAGALALRRTQDQRLALVAEAAHELRGPLCAARLGLHALESAGDPVARRAAAVELELRRAGLALDDLAAAPRGRRTSDRRELVDAGALLAGAALGWSALARAHGARLRVEAPRETVLVRGDRLRLAQALGNLVANAAEHGGGEVVVRGLVVRGTVRIEVSDEGPGLPASVCDLVGLGDTRGPRGHGVAVAARIAARHGGQLASAPSGRGARLVLELPLARPEPPPMLWPRHAVAGPVQRDAGVASLEEGSAAPHGAASAGLGSGSAGSLGAGSAGPLGNRSAGLLGAGSAGPLGNRSAGSLGAGSAGPPGHPAASEMRAAHPRSASAR